MAVALTEDQIKECEESFALFDQQGQGTVQTKDLGYLVRSLGQNPSSAEVKEMIREVDPVGSGSFDFAKFLQLRARRLTDTDSVQELKEAFKVFDENNTGYISSSKMHGIMAGLGENLNSQEIDEMFNDADIDGDGRLSFKEFAIVMTAR